MAKNVDPMCPECGKVESPEGGCGTPQHPLSGTTCKHIVEGAPHAATITSRTAAGVAEHYPNVFTLNARLCPECIGSIIVKVATMLIA